MSCCKPLYTVISADITDTIVTYTVSPQFADIGQNAPFCLCVSLAQVPQASTALIQITDGTTTYADVRVASECSGNFLRADSLRKYKCAHPCQLLYCYRGSDPAHVMVNNRMCPSSFAAAEVALDTLGFAAADAGAPATIAAATAGTKKASAAS